MRRTILLDEDIAIDTTDAFRLLVPVMPVTVRPDHAATALIWLERRSDSNCIAVRSEARRLVSLVYGCSGLIIFSL